MSPQASTTPARFGLKIPDTWFVFDVPRLQRSGDITRIIDQRIAETPQLRPQRATIVRACRQLIDFAAESGALLCAGCADYTDDRGSLLASLVVVKTDGMPEPALNTVEAIAAQLTATPRPAEGEDPEADWREVRLVDLPAGRAVRVLSKTSYPVSPEPDLAGLREEELSTLEPQQLTSASDSPTKEVVRVHSMQTLIPIPTEEGEEDPAILNVAFTTPQEGLVEQLFDLFDAVSSTLSWEQGPTTR